MNFFYYQPEDLATINIILGSRLFGYPAIIVLGSAFLLLSIIGYILARHYKKNTAAILTVCAVICWLPLMANFFYGLVMEFNNTWFVLGLPVKEQIIWRHCRIDKNQNLGGKFCAIYPFVEKVREYVPADSKIAFVRTQASAYLSYYLYREYKIVDESSAEYLISYLPIENKEPSSEFKLWQFLAPGQVIYKRQ